MDSPIKWHGGKHYFAKKFIALMPPHLHYVEPYAGSLAVLLERDHTRDWLIDQDWKLKNGDKVPTALKGCSEVVNDLNGELTNFWCVLSDPVQFEKFRRKVEAIPFSESHWQAVGEHDDGAVGFFVRCRQSMSGRFKDFAPLSRTRTRRGMNEQASAWLNCVEGLPAVHERLKRVVILNRDALKVIRGQDGEHTFFYLDPPYLHETRATTGEYAHEMTEAQHTDLLETLATIRGKFQLSGYRSRLYDKYASVFNWRRVDFDAPNNAAGGNTKRRMTECLWMNYGANG